MSTGAKNMDLYITLYQSSKIKHHIKAVMHHTMTYFNSKYVKHPHFFIYFQHEKLTGNEIFLRYCISNHIFTLIFHLGLI